MHKKKTKIKKAMILAAGFGKRLNPITIDCPKPLLRIKNETLLANTIKFLKNYGIKEIVINTHYLAEQIIEYVNRKKFNLPITIVKENKKILDTGGGILNTIKYFEKEPFIVINPDTLWGSNYFKSLKLMENTIFKKNDCKCILSIVNKKSSFDKNFKGDFNVNGILINKKKNNFRYIYTGLQIIKPESFNGFKDKVFSLNKVWNKLIDKKKLYGIESKVNFFHVSNLKIYKELLVKFKR